MRRRVLNSVRSDMFIATASGRHKLRRSGMSQSSSRPNLTARTFRSYGARKRDPNVDYKHFIPTGLLCDAMRHE